MAFLLILLRIFPPKTSHNKYMKKRFIAFILLLVSALGMIFFVNATPAECGEKPTEAPIDLPIIMYHRTNSSGAGTYNVLPSMLEDDLEWIKTNGYTTIHVIDLIAFQKYGVPLPPKPIMLTFDDGYYSNYVNAFELLKKHNMKAVYAIVGAYTDEAEKPWKVKFPHLTYAQIKEMHESGLIEIQNHTYDLHKTGNRLGIRIKKGESVADYEEMLREDFLRNHNQLKEKTGAVCTAVVFPYGVYCKEALVLMQKIGYNVGITCNGGINKITKDSCLLELKRFNRPADESVEKILRKYI